MIFIRTIIILVDKIVRVSKLKNGGSRTGVRSLKY